MDAAIRGRLTCQVADAHGGALHSVVVLVDSADDPCTALTRACHAALGERIILCGPPWRAIDAAGAKEALDAAQLDHKEIRVVVFDPAQIRGDADHTSYEADAAAGRAVEAGVRVPRTLAEAKGWGLVRRESSADAEAGSSPGSGPLQRALGDFATQFRLRRAQGEAYERAAEARAHACAGLASRASIRDLGVAAALATLVDHASTLEGLHEQVRLRGERHGSVQREALERFEDDLESLDAQPLHPALAEALQASTGEAGGRTLSACVPRDRVRKWAEHCARSLASFEGDGAKLEAVVSDVTTRVARRVRVGASQARAAALDCVAADAAVCQALAARQAQLVDALGRDERDASDLVAKHCAEEASTSDLTDNELSSPRAQFDLDLSGENLMRDSFEEEAGHDECSPRKRSSSSSAVALDACRDLQARWERRERLLPVIKATERALAQCARSCAARADALATAALGELRDVGALQTTIHDAQATHLEAHGDALDAKARAFAQLDTVRALPKVHAALCLEVARRRAYGTSVASLVQKATADVSVMRERETRRRARFSRVHGAKLPRPLLRAVPGLVDPPVAFAPTFAPDERALPHIGLDDLGADGAPRRPRADSHDSALAAQTSSVSDVAMEGEGSSSDDDTDDDDDEHVLRAKCARLECELAALRAVSMNAAPPPEAAADVSESEEVPRDPKISFRRFDLGDVALFLPTGGDGRKAYLAFHHGCPHRYLSPASVEAIRAAHQRYPDFILGRVTRSAAREASAVDNPFRLPAGTVFHVLTVESL